MAHKKETVERLCDVITGAAERVMRELKQRVEDVERERDEAVARAEKAERDLSQERIAESDMEIRYEDQKRRAEKADAALACEICAGTKSLPDGSACACGDGTAHGIARAYGRRMGDEFVRANTAEANHKKVLARVSELEKLVSSLALEARNNPPGKCTYAYLDSLKAVIQCGQEILRKVGM